MPEIESIVPRRQLGRYLRELRQESGLTIAEAAELIERGSSTLQRLEKGTADRVRVLDVEALCRIYDSDRTTTAALIGLAQQAKVKSWWHEFGDLIPENFDVYMGLEAAARSVVTYQVELVPGLLQTRAYARAVICAGYPNESVADHDRRVKMRVRRQSLITRRDRPAAIDVVLHETLTRRVVGGRGVMAAQLRHLADASTRENISLRILPFSAGIPSGMVTGQFTILDFGAGKTEPSVVYVPSFIGDMYLEKNNDVRRYHQAYEAIRGGSLDVGASRNLLRQAAREIEQ